MAAVTMTSVSLVTDDPSSVDVLATTPSLYHCGKFFISVRLADGYVSLTIPGFDETSAAFARTLAAQLIAAADDVVDRLARENQPELVATEV